MNLKWKLWKTETKGFYPKVHSSTKWAQSKHMIIHSYVMHQWGTLVKPGQPNMKCCLEYFIADHFGSIKVEKALEWAIGRKFEAFRSYQISTANIDFPNWSHRHCKSQCNAALLLWEMFIPRRLHFDAPVSQHWKIYKKHSFRRRTPDNSPKMASTNKNETFMNSFAPLCIEILVIYFLKQYRNLVFQTLGTSHNRLKNISFPITGTHSIQPLK